MVKEYLKRNKIAYDKGAEGYNARHAEFGKFNSKFYPKLLKPFQDKLKQDFCKTAKILDIGCGTGRELKILSNHGFLAYGIDLSPKTVLIAKKNVPSAKIIVGNFLTKSFNTKFHGIVMISSFHLFPKNDVPLVLRKLNSLLVPGGYCLISIIKSAPKHAKRSDEGYFPQKADPRIIRFKTRYTERDFKRIFNNLSWASVSKFYRRTEREYLKQKWINIIIKKNV